MAANRTVSVALKAQVGDYVSGMDRAAKSTRQVGDEAEGTGKRSSSGLNVAKTAATGFAAAGVLALGAMVKTSMDFDKAMSGVGAAANATGGELSQLREAAIKAGADTAFSASEAASAEEELAKAGVSVKDVLGGGLKGALDLAAAGQLDVGQAAEIAATAMTQFKLSGSDIPHVADLLAAGAGKAQGSVEDIGMALKQSGLVASQFGLSIDETVGTLASFASAGLIGSDAGTSFKTMLLALANPSKQSAETMKELGINAYDAGGKFVGTAGLAGQLQKALGGLTEAQRNQALAQIFGSDAIRAANVLYLQGSAGIKDWTGKVNDAGFASEQANAKLNNLSGDLQTLQGSLETALIKGGSSATGVLRALTKGATGAVNAFSNLPGPLQTGITGLIAVGTAGSGALAALGTFGPKIREARTELQSMGRAGEIANAGISKVGKGLAIGSGVLVGLETAGLLMRKLQDASNDAVPGVEEVKSALVGVSTAADLQSKLPKLGDNLKYLGEQIGRLADPSLGDQAAKTLVNIATLGNADPQKLRTAQTNIKAIDDALASLVSSGHADQAEAAFNKLTTTANLSSDQIEQFKRVLPGYRDALAGVANDGTLAAAGTKKAGDAAAAAGQQVGGASAPTKGLSEDQAVLAVAAGKTAVALDDEADATKVLSGALDLISGKSLGVAESQISLMDSMAKLTGAVKENGRTLDQNTQKGRDNASAIFSAVEAAEKRAQAETDLTGSVDKGIAVYDRSVTAIRAAAAAAGFNKAQVDALIASVYKTPAQRGTKYSAPGAVQSKAQIDAHNRAAAQTPARKATQVSAPGATDAAGKMNRVTQAANGIPTYKQTTVRVLADGATTAVQRVVSALASLHDRTVVVNVVRAGQANPAGGYAEGTPSAPPGMAWVGERGRELIDFRGGERVYPHSKSEQIAAAAAGMQAFSRPTPQYTPPGSGGGRQVNLGGVNLGGITVVAGQDARPRQVGRQIVDEVSAALGAQIDQLLKVP